MSKEKEDIKLLNVDPKTLETPEEKFDFVCGLTKQMADVLKGQAEKSSEDRVKLDKMHEDFKALQGNVSDFKTIADTQLKKVEDQEKDDKEQQKIWDVTLKDSGVRKMWGYDDPITKALYHPRTTWTPQSGYKLTGSYDGLEDLMEVNDALFIMGMSAATRSGNIESYPEKVKSFDTYKLFKFELQQNAELRKALNTSDDNDWIPTAMSAQMIDDLRLKVVVPALFPSINLPLKSGSYDYPFSGTRRRAYLMPESTDDSSSKIPTATVPSGKVTFSVIKHALRMLASYEMIEDSIVPIIPIMRREIVQALADGEEDAIVNGDDSSTHMDTGSGITSTDVRASFDGLRYHGGDATGNGGEACVDISSNSTTLLRSIRKKMGRFGAISRDLAWVTSFSGYMSMMDLTEVRTVDKYGTLATILSGEMAKFDGVPVVVSEFVSSELNTSGLYDGATVTDTVILLVNKEAFWRAYKGTMLSESERDIEVQQHKVVMSRRLTFENIWTPGSGEEIVGVGYSLTA